MSRFWRYITSIGFILVGYLGISGLTVFELKGMTRWICFWVSVAPLGTGISLLFSSWPISIITSGFLVAAALLVGWILWLQCPVVFHRLTSPPLLHPLFFVTLVGGGAVLSLVTKNTIVGILRDFQEMFRMTQIKKILLYFCMAYVLTIFFCGLGYATIYKLVGRDSFCLDKTRQLSLLDFMYFSTVTITTLGYGDIEPVHYSAQILSMAEVIIGIILVVIYLGFAIRITKI